MPPPDPTEVDKWAALLTGAAPPQPPPKESVYRPAVGHVPSVEYVDWLLSELLRLGYDIRITGPDEFAVGPSVPSQKGKLPPLPGNVLASVRRWRDDLVMRAADVYGLSDRARGFLALPRGPGWALEYVNPAGETGRVRSEDLPTVDWVQWRYKDGDVWRSPTGELWRDVEPATGSTG